MCTCNIHQEKPYAVTKILLNKFPVRNPIGMFFDNRIKVEINKNTVYRKFSNT